MARKHMTFGVLAVQASELVSKFEIKGFMGKKIEI